MPEGPAAADPVRVFREGVYPYANRMKRAKYERLKAGLQIELLKAQHCLLHLWRRARKEAGLDDVRLHDLRHTVASQAVARGVPLSTVARMLGHSDPKMTLRYAHVGDRDLQAAAERIGKAIEIAMEAAERPEPAEPTSRAAHGLAPRGEARNSPSAVDRRTGSGPIGASIP